MAMLVITRWYIPVFSVVVVVSAARMILEPAADAAPQWFPAVDQLGFVEFHNCSVATQFHGIIQLLIISTDWIWLNHIYQLPAITSILICADESNHMCSSCFHWVIHSKTTKMPGKKTKIQCSNLIGTNFHSSKWPIRGEQIPIPRKRTRITDLITLFAKLLLIFTFIKSQKSPQKSQVSSFQTFGERRDLQRHVGLRGFHVLRKVLRGARSQRLRW